MEQNYHKYETIKLHMEKIGRSLEMDMTTLPQILLITLQLLYVVYTLFFVSKLIRHEIKWQTWTFLVLGLIFLTGWTLVKFGYMFLGFTISIFGLLRHWGSLPQQSIPPEGKAILVTGCDRGIGHELAKKLDSMGYYVFAGCLFKGQHGEQALVAACSSRLKTLQMDVSNRDQVQLAAEQVQSMLGENNLWAVVNNAGICYIGNIEIMSTEDIENVMAINYMGPINVCRAFLPLIRRSKGRLVNVASNAGLAPVPHMGVYCASKAALATFSESLRYELEQWEVKVSTVIPSGYRTGILAYDKAAAAERWWKSASSVVKEDFGKECFTPKFKYENHESNTSADLSSIVNTIVEAVSVKNPQPFYYSGFLARTLPFVYLHLPRILQEPVMKLLAHWFNFEPRALMKTSKRDRNVTDQKMEKDCRPYKNGKHRKNGFHKHG